MAIVELLYFWVEEYKILKKIGFNFSNKYIIKFNPEPNELLIEDNPNYVEDLFNNDVKEADNDHSYITSITALVGKNMVGKTTIMKCLMDLLNSDLDIGFNNGSFALFKVDNKLYMFGNNNVIINQQQQKEIGGIDTKSFMRFWKKFEAELEFVYHSDIFDPLLINNKIPNDISLNGIISETMLNLNNYNPLVKDLLRDLRIYNSTIQMEYLIKNAVDPENILKLPKYLRVQINDTPTQIIKNPYSYGLQDNKIIGDSFEIIKGLYKKNENYLSKMNNNEIFYARLLLNGYLSVLLHYIWKGKTRASITVGKTELKQMQSVVSEYLKELEEILHKNKNLEEFMASADINSDFYKKINNVKKVNLAIANMENAIFKLDYNSIVFDLKQINIAQQIIGIYIAYYKNDDQIDYLNIALSHESDYTTPLSAGENAILNLYGRLDNWNVNNKNKQYPNNVLILLDEVDLLLHPSWQIDFFYKIIYFLRNDFKNINIQLIVATHSPLILSDLPNYCIIKLERDKESGEVKVIENNENTFGANVTKLLADSFFLNEGVVGSFAKKKINKIIQELNSKDLKLDDITYKGYKNMIGLIGEDFIREKLSQLLEYRKNEAKMEKL